MSCFADKNKINEITSEDSSFNENYVRLYLSRLQKDLKTHADLSGLSDSVITNAIRDISAKELKEYAEETNKGNNNAYLKFLPKEAKKFTPRRSVPNNLLEAIQSDDSTSKAALDAEIIERNKASFQDYKTQVRANRVSMLTQKFIQKVTELVMEKKGIEWSETADAGESLRERQEIIKLYHNQGDSIFNRVLSDVLNYINTPNDLLVKEAISRMKNTELMRGLSESQLEQLAPDFIERTKREYRKMLVHWDALTEASLREVAQLEQLVIDINRNRYKANEVVQVEENPDGSFKESISGEVEEFAPKEHIFQNILKVNPALTLAPEVRRVIASVPMLDYNGKAIYDDLGFPKYVNPTIVYEDMLVHLSESMKESTDLMPQLKGLAKQKPWIEGVTSLLSENPELIPKFFTAFALDGKHMIILTNSTDPKDNGSKLVSRNRFESAHELYDRWRSNYATGYTLTRSSIYNSSAEFKPEVIKKNAERFDAWYQDITKANYNTARREQALIDANVIELLDLVRALGIDITKEHLINMIKYEDSSKDLVGINTLIGRLHLIYDGLQNQNLTKESAFDLINTYASSFTEIAKVLSSVSEQFYMNNVREGNQSYWTYTARTMLGTLIKTLSGKYGQEYLTAWVEEHKADEWFYNSKTQQWNIDWLNDIVDPQTNKLLPAAKRLENVLLLHNRRVEMKDWGNNRHMNTALTLYYEEKLKNKDYGFYELPTLADSGRYEAILFKKYSKDYRNVLTKKFIDIVKLEISRINKVNERYRRFNLNPGDENYLAPEYFIDAFDRTDSKLCGAQFFFIPELNNQQYVDLLFSEASAWESSKKMLELEAAIQQIMDARFNAFIEARHKDGLFDVTKEGTHRHLPFEGNRNYQLELLSDHVKAAKQFLGTSTHSSVDSFLYNLEHNKFISNEDIQDMIQDLKALLPEDYKGLNALSFKDTIVDKIEEFYWNYAFASSQMTMLLTKDLAFYPNYDAVLKRASQAIKGGTKYDVHAMFDGKLEGRTHKNTIIIADPVMESNILDSIKLMFDERVKNKWHTRAEANEMLETFKKMLLTDGQGYVDMDTRRAEEIMLGNWDRQKEDSFKRFKNGTWTRDDFFFTLNNSKPFTAGLIESVDENGNTILVPTQIKNSEVMLSLMGIQEFNPVLKAFNRLLQDSNGQINAIQFKSNVKVGASSILSIDPNVSENEIYTSLRNQIYENNVPRTNIIHSIPYGDSALQHPTPSHSIDATIAIGSQIRLLGLQEVSSNQLYEYEGVQYTADEIKHIYNKINVQNIQRSLIEVDETFKDPRKIEYELKRLTLDRNLYSQAFVDGLTWDNTTKQFRQPLYDMTVTTKVQNLVMSLIKNKISKQNMKGGRAYQISNIGYHNDLSVRFKDANGNLIEKGDTTTTPHSIAYVEAYLPIHDSRFYSLFKGDIKNIPPQLLNMIAYRIPTEGPYSMFPLKIVGFTDALTEGIMVPTDLLNISGFDFDIDKLFFLAKDFYLGDHGISKEDFSALSPKERQEVINKHIIMPTLNPFKDGKVVTDPELRMRLINKAIEEVANDSRASNNIIQDMLWQQLTSHEGMNRMFTPGSTRDIRRIGDILEVAKLYTGKDIHEMYTAGKTSTKTAAEILLSLPSSELKKLLANRPQLDSPIFFDTNLANREKTMSGANLISRFANTSTLHAKFNSLGLGINSNHAISLNGKVLTELDPSSITDGETQRLLSYTISSFIGASVDNATQPILGRMNANESTAPFISYLLQLGYNVLEIGLLMSQPIMKQVVNQMRGAEVYPVDYKGNIEGKLAYYENEYVSLLTGEAADSDSEVAKAAHMTLKRNLSTKGPAIDLNNETLLNSIWGTWGKGKAGYGQFLRSQILVGETLLKMLPAVESVKNLTLALRADSTSFAGGDIASALSKAIDLRVTINQIYDKKIIHGIESIMDILQEGEVFNQKERMSVDKIMKSKMPIVEAFTKSLLYNIPQWMSKPYFPYFTPKFQGMIDQVSHLSATGSLTPRILNKLFQHGVAYQLLVDPIFGDEYLAKEDRVATSSEKRIHYLLEFMWQLKEATEKYSGFDNIEFVKRFIYSPIVSNKNHNKVGFQNAGKITGALREMYETEQNSLMYKPVGRALMNDLLRYTYYANLLGFSNDGFAHLFSLLVKEDMAPALHATTQMPVTYMESMRNVLNNNMDFGDHFIELFVRNNPTTPLIIGKADKTDITYLDAQNKPLEKLDITLEQLQKNPVLVRQHMLRSKEANTLLGAAHPYISFNSGNILYKKIGKSDANLKGVQYERINILAGSEYVLPGDNLISIGTPGVLEQFAKSIQERAFVLSAQETETDIDFAASEQDDNISAISPIQDAINNLEQTNNLKEIESIKVKDANNLDPCN